MVHLCARTCVKNTLSIVTESTITSIDSSGNSSIFVYQFLQFIFITTVVCNSTGNFCSGIPSWFAHTFQVGVPVKVWILGFMGNLLSTIGKKILVSTNIGSVAAIHALAIVTTIN